jgi:hypothetical protein
MPDCRGCAVESIRIRTESEELKKNRGPNSRLKSSPRSTKKRKER